MMRVFDAKEDAGDRLVIVTGHYGSGKTEFAVNYAFAVARAGRAVTLADLDIVNPYFCSRERKDALERSGVRVILSAGGNADLPALNAAVYSLIEPGVTGIMDVGGDAAGARVLGRFAQKIREIEHELYCVVNANRPETATKERAAKYIDEIGQSAGLAVTGIVNNTHLCGETTAEDILRGAGLAEEVSAITGIPVIYHAVERRLMHEIDLPSGILFPMEIHMKKPWEIDSMEVHPQWQEK